MLKEVYDGAGHKAFDGFSVFQSAADFGAADVIKTGVEEMDGFREFLFIYYIAWTRIDAEFEVVQDVLATIPTREEKPVVGADEKNKLMLRILRLEFVESCPHV